MCAFMGPGQLRGQGCWQRKGPGEAAPPEDQAEGPGWQETSKDLWPCVRKALPSWAKEPPQTAHISTQSFKGDHRAPALRKSHNLQS